MKSLKSLQSPWPKAAQEAASGTSGTLGTFFWTLRTRVCARTYARVTGEKSLKSTKSRSEHGTGLFGRDFTRDFPAQCAEVPVRGCTTPSCLRPAWRDSLCWWCLQMARPTGGRP
jgi:hypothetical protein